MKKVAILPLMVFIGVVANAEIGSAPFAPEEFDVDIIQYPHMLQIENPQSEQLDTYYTFTNKEASYQIRYSFFKQTVKDYADIKTAFSMCILPIIWNIAGYETDKITNFNDSDVKDEFNGDFGATCSIVNSKSDYGDGYKYMVADFFYKNNQGIVIRTMLFNDLKFYRIDKTFLEIYHSFKFHE